MKSTLPLIILFAALVAELPAQRARDGGPDSVDALLEERSRETPGLLEKDFTQRLDDSLEAFAERSGLTLGSDYSSLFYSASGRPDDAFGDASSGMARIYGRWDLLNRGGDNNGALNFKVEHRHRYSEIAPSAFSLNLGNVGVMGGPFNDNGWRLTNLYWRQGVGDRAVTYLGFLDATDFVDAYGLASPWNAFTNLAFSTGSASMALPNDATFGAMFGLWATDQIYTVASITDLNSDPTDPFQSAEAFFDENEYFKSLEIGWTSSKDRFYTDNIHLTFWHVDEVEATGTPDGWGVNWSASYWVDDAFMPFLRGGYTEDGGSLLEASVSAGVAANLFDKRDLVGVAANWGQPNETTFGPGLDDQFGIELFYRLQVSEGVRVTPSVQLLWDPALNPDEDFAAVFGLRGVVTF